MGVAAITVRDCYLPKEKAIADLKNIFWCVLTIIAVFSRMRGNKILERFTVQDFNTPHSCDYRYKEFYCKVIRRKKLDLRSDIEKML